MECQPYSPLHQEQPNTVSIPRMNLDMKRIREMHNFCISLLFYLISSLDIKSEQLKSHHDLIYSDMIGINK